MKIWLQYQLAILKKPVAILIIRIALLLMLAAFAVFISADLLLWKATPGLPGFLTQLGLAALLSAFALLLVTGLWVIAKLVITDSLDYFSTRQRLERRLLFSENKQAQFKQRFHFRKLQINYFNELKRQRLLRANNRQHLHLLSHAIDNDLLKIKGQLCRATYLQLQQENVRYRNQQDIEALLLLQQKIATLF